MSHTVNSTAATDAPVSAGSSPSATERKPDRVVSIDVYRGMVMFLMLAELMHLHDLADIFPGEQWAQWLHFHTTHVAWEGCSLHDLIQPGFTFLVGVAMPFSIASRLRRGGSKPRLMLHAAVRSVVLIALGIVLRSLGRDQTYFTFEDTLTQIGLGYFPLFLISLAPKRVWWISLLVILVGTWGAFALYPAPPADFDYAAVGVDDGWTEHGEGLAAHWNKNANLAWKVDTWFLNLFPRAEPFLFNSGGYATLSFLPTLGTSLLGLIAGGWLLSNRTSWAKLGMMVAAGGVCLGAGLALDLFGICPSVKRIWTPSWVLVSGGWCFLLLAGFYLLNDMTGFAVWSFPLRVIGMNSIAAYMIAHLIEGFLRSNFHTFLGEELFYMAGNAYEPLVSGGAVLGIYWLILFWMARRKLFLRI